MVALLNPVDGFQMYEAPPEPIKTVLLPEHKVTLLPALAVNAAETLTWAVV